MPLILNKSRRPIGGGGEPRFLPGKPRHVDDGVWRSLLKRRTWAFYAQAGELVVVSPTPNEGPGAEADASEPGPSPSEPEAPGDEVPQDGAPEDGAPEVSAELEAAADRAVVGSPEGFTPETVAAAERRLAAAGEQPSDAPGAPVGDAGERPVAEHPAAAGKSSGRRRRR